MNRQEAAQEQKLRNYFPWFGGLCLLYGVLFAFCMYRNLFGCTFFISGGFQKIRVKIPAVAGTERQGFTSDGTIYGTGSKLIRRSIERPADKEKLRIRSYEQVCPESTVFVELKRKYRSVVYKRRIGLPEEQAVKWVMKGEPCGTDSQIAREAFRFG